MENSRATKLLVDSLARPLEEAAAALMCLADSVKLWVSLEQKRFEKDFPHIDIKAASIGVAKYANPERDKPEEQGDIFPKEKEDRWAGIGPRERRRIEAEERTSRRLQKQKDRRTP
jgi:hypothetical protein